MFQSSFGALFDDLCQRLTFHNISNVTVDATEQCVGAARLQIYPLAGI
jgi:hypothetical protein